MKTIDQDNKIYTRRNSLRLNEYDYSQEGLYFITINIQDMLLLFGNIKDGEMQLNDAGKMVAKWFNKLPTNFATIKCHESIVMPNHFHSIIEINKDDTVDTFNMNNLKAERHCQKNNKSRNNDLDEIPQIIDWFKTMTTNEYIRGVKQNNWKTFNHRLWQRSYYDHIIRTNKAHDYIYNYIINNPQNWEKDTFFV